MSFRNARRLADVRRRLFLEPLENRQLMTIDLEVALRVTAAGQTVEQPGTDITEIDLNGQYQVRGNVRDLRLPATANSGVFQAYFDVNFGAGAGTAAAANIAGAFPVGQEDGTASATSVDLLGGSGNGAATVASQALFLIPFTATTAGIYTFTPELTADQLLFPTALRPNDPVDVNELSVVTDTLTVLPLTDAIADPAAVLEDSAATNVGLTGIAGGAGTTIAVGAVAADPTLVDVSVTYTSGNATGTVVVTPKPDKFGTTLITVSTTVNGAVRQRTFNFTINAVDDPPEIQLPVGGNTVTFTEAGGAISIAPAATVVDVDNPANFNNGSLQAAINANGDVADVLTVENQGNGAGQIGVGGGNVSYQGTVIGTFVANPLGFDINFNANATPVAVQALVRAITFDSPGANPSPLTRNVALTIDDGTPAASTTTNISVLINVNNDPPTITTNNGPIAYTEAAPAIALDAAATVTDVDSADFDTGTLNVAVVAGAQAEDVLAITNQGNGAGQIGVAGANVSFGGVVIGTFTGGTAVNPLVVTFNAASSPAAAQALVRAITFFNNSAAPTPAKTVQFDLTDGDGGLDTDDVNINITAVNTAPIITSVLDANYTENAAAVQVDPALTITDADSPDFNTGSLTVSIQTNGDATDFLEINNEGNGVGQIGVAGNNVSFGGVLIGTFTGGDGVNPLVITFNAASSPAAAQQLARNVTFRSTSDNPAATKTVRFVINDGDQGVSQDDSTVTITAVNDNPAIVTNPVLLNYTANSPAAIIANATTISDVDSPDFNTGSLTVTLTTGGQATDRVEINNQGNGVGQIGVNGANVTFGGVVIGTFTGGIGLTPLVITFNAASSPAAAEALARNITFRTTGAPAAGARTMSFQVNDGDTGTDTDAITINITLSQDPVLNFPGSPVAYIENAAAIILDPTATATDADSANFDGGTLTVEVTTGPEAGETLAVESVGNGVGQIGVNGANVAFGGVVFATFVGGQGAPLVFTFDADATPAIVQELLRHITYHSTNDDPVIAKVITFTLDDGAGGQGIDTLDLNVTPVNDDPILTPLPIVDAQYTEGGAPALVIPQSTVVDPDSDFTTGSLTVTITTAGEATDELFVLDQGVNPGEIFEVGGAVSFGGLVFATLVGGTNNQPLVITFNANATVPAVQALVRRIAFDSTSTNPSILVRTVTFALADGDGGTDTDTADVQVTAVNSPPVLTLLPAAAATFTEGGGAIILAPGSTVTDPDSPNFDTGSLTVSIIANADALDQLSINNQGVGANQIGVNGTNVTFGGVLIGTVAGNNSPTLIVNLNTAATPAAVEALVANIAFNNTSNNPSILTRTVSFTVDDGDGDNDTAQKDVNVIAINDDPVVTLSPEGVAITGANPSQRITAAPTVTDTDSPNFAGGMLTISITANGTADDRLEFAAPVTTNVATVLVNGVDVGTFVGGVGAADLVITFNANATPALVTTLLGNIVYRHNNPVAAEPTRTVQVDLTDGGGGVSNPVTKQITILGANQAPVVTAPAAAVAYTENDPETAVFTGTTVTDDNADFAGGFLSVSIFGNATADDRIALTPNANVTLNGANVLVGGVQVGTLATTSEVTGGNPLTINFNASATPARVELLLTAITYENVSDNPSVLPRTVRVIIDDGAGASDSADRTVNVTAVNDNPDINTAVAVAYTEGAVPVVIDAAATVTDPDSANFDTGTLTVAVTTGGDALDDLDIQNQGVGPGQIGVNGANVTFGGVTIGTFVGGTGVTPLVITFNAQATPAIVQALVRNITYSSTSNAPPAQKTVTFTVTDGDTGTDNDFTLVNITAVNDAPVVTTAAAVAYTEGAAAVIIDATATVTDVDSPDFAGGLVTVTMTTGNDADDRLAINNEGNGANQINTNGTDVRFGTTVIGTFAGGDGVTPLTITLNVNATPAIVQQLLRNITYRSLSDNPIVAKVVTFSVADGDGDTGTDFTNVNVTAVNDAPTVTTVAAVAYTENAAAVIIDATATVTDPDSPDFAGGSLTATVTAAVATDQLAINNQGVGVGQIGVNAANVTFGGTVIGTFAGGNGTPLVITLNASATLAAVQALLRNITYASTSDNPAAQRTVTFDVADGDGGTGSDFTVVNITAVNDPPVQTLPSGNLAYTENAAPVAIDAAATVVDPDSDFNTGTLTVSIPNGNDATDILAIRNDGVAAGQIGVNGANVTFGGTTIGTFAGGTGTTALVITFNASATPAAVQALERALVYSTTSDNPPATKSVRLVLTDGDGGTDTDEKAINITAVNDSPVQTLSTETVSYTGTAIAISATGTVTDVDSANFDTGTLTVSFNAGGIADDRLTINNQGTGTGQISFDGSNVRFENVIIGTFTGGTGTTNLVITFNTAATPAAVQALERQILFSNVNSATPASTRTVRFVLTDGDGGTDTDDKQISLVASGTPVVILSTETVTYTENAVGVAIGATSTVTDSNSTNFNTGNLTVTLTQNGTVDDRIEIRNDGTGANQIGVNGSNVTFGGTTIGTFTGGSGTTPLVVTLNANATPAATQALLRAITFRNVSENPSVLARTVSVTVSDGTGLTSVASTKNIAVVAVNDPPVQTLPGAAVAYAPQAAAVVLDATATVTDPDSPDFATGTLTVSIFAGGESTDVLAIRNEGTGANQIGVSGANVTFGGTTIGTFVGGTGTTPLVITFNASATPAAVQALERNILFSNTAAAPNSTKTARFVLTDGDGGSDTDDKSITIAAAGTPVVTLSTETVTYTENGAAVAIAATSTVSDPNSTNFNTGNLTVTITAGATADDRIEIRNDGTAANQIGVNGNNVTFGGTTIGTFTGGTGTTALVITLNASATPAATQALLRAITYRNVSENPSTTTRTVSVTVNDGTGLTSVAQTKSVTVVAVNDAPVNTVPGAQNTALNTNVVFNAANNNLISVNDVDLVGTTTEVQVTIATTNGALTLSGITGLTFTAGDGTADATMTFRGTLANVNAALNGLTFIPTTGFTGAGVITLTTSDQGNTGTGGTLTDTDTVTVNVGNFNITGSVFVDINNDGIRNNGELGIPNVTITVTGADANTQGVTRTVTTGADGTYTVTGLAPGQYRVVETQPANFYDGKTTPPTGGTVDANGVLVTVTAGQALDGPHFGELGLIAGKITLELFLASTPSNQIVINDRAPGGAKALNLAGGAVNGGNVQSLATSAADKAIQAVINSLLASAGRITAASSSASTRTTSATNSPVTLQQYSASGWTGSTRPTRTTSSAPRTVAQLQDALSQIEVRTADLPDGKLAETVGNVITFDINAAGQGWFVDPTPSDNEEFFAQYGQLQAAAGGAAAGKVDLLTVAAHEIGHVLGLDDLYTAADDGDVMSDDLVPGVRKEFGDDLLKAILGE